MLRYAIPFHQSPYMNVDDEGNLIGPWSNFLRGDSYGRSSQYNLSFTIPKEQISNDMSIPKQAFAIVNRGDADITIAFPCIGYGQHENITFGTFFSSYEWFLLTWPKIRSSVESNGPMVALLQMRLDILFAVFFSLTTILLVSIWNWRSKIRENLTWLFFSIFMWKMNVPSFNKFAAGISILCIFSIYIWYGSFLNTERTSITSYERVNKLEDLKEDSTLLIGQTSFCDNGLRNNARTRVVDFSSFAEQFFRCLESAECVIYVSLLECKILRCDLCAVRPEYLLDHAVYLSPPLRSSHLMMIYNKNANKLHLRHYNQRVHRSFEMGISKKRGIGSDSALEAFFEQFTGIHLDQECMTQVILPSFSGPVALSTEYFSSFIYLHLFMIIIASTLSIWQNILLYSPL